MNLIPNDFKNWSIDTINELTTLRDIESETFDFKGTDIKDLAKHLCAFANTHGGFLVLGIDEVKNGDIKTGFKKNGFKIGKEDSTKNEIRNYQIQIEPSIDMQVEIIPDDSHFFVVIKVHNNSFKKPFFIKNKDLCYVRVGPSSSTASRSTILELFSDTKSLIQDLENFKSSIAILQDSLNQTLDIFGKISSSPPNRVPKLDLSFVKNNIVQCESFLREKNLLTVTRILHTLETLNSYIDGFNSFRDYESKKILQDQVFGETYTLYNNLQNVQPFFDKLTKAIDKHLTQIQNN